MENLLKCSKVLYDANMSDKMKEITQLKNKIKELEDKNPKIMCKTYKEWDLIMDNLMNQIANSGIHNIHFVEDLSDFECFGLDYWHTDNADFFSLTLTQILTSLLNDRAWAEKQVTEIFFELSNVFACFKVKDSFSETDRNANILELIRQKLYAGRRAILAKIPHYKCFNCNEIFNEEWGEGDCERDTEKEVICFECEYKRDTQ